LPVILGHIVQIQRRTDKTKPKTDLILQEIQQYFADEAESKQNNKNSTPKQ